MKTFKTPLVVPWMTVLCLALAAQAQAATLTQAKFTVVQNDVSVLTAAANRTDKKPAAVNDTVTSDKSVATGKSSRAELVFNDKSVARIGANTIFNFTPGKRDMFLQQGSLLFNIAKGQGVTEIRTAAVTAAITGTTGLMQTAPGYFALYLYEGTITVHGHTLHAGEGLIIRNGVEELIHFDIRQSVETSNLFKLFGPLPSDDAINQAANDAGKPGNPDGGLPDQKDQNVLNPHVHQPDEEPPPTRVIITD